MRGYRTKTVANTEAVPLGSAIPSHREIQENGQSTIFPSSRACGFSQVLLPSPRKDVQREITKDA
jgi:hypothetical protein